MKAVSPTLSASPEHGDAEGQGENMAEHMYAFDRAYLVDSAREWLFRQTK